MQSNSTSFKTLWHNDLAQAGKAGISWIWHGYLAPGNVTLLTGQWKSGKTTLVSALLGRLGAGGQLAGLQVRAGKAAIITEEGPTHWHQRGKRFRFGQHLCWLCQPFSGKPTPAEWLALIDHLAGLRREHGIDLVVIDPLASFLPGRGENDSSTMLECLLPLQHLTNLGMAVLLLHHPRKAAAVPGRQARGSGALSGYVDIMIEMDWHTRPGNTDRRRRLAAFSRHTETSRERVIELNEAGNDYRYLGDFEDADFAERWQVLRQVFEGATRKLTRKGLLARWPHGERKPDSATLWRWLERAVEKRLVQREGTGRRNDPYQFSLPGKAFPEGARDFIRRQEREDREMLRRMGQNSTQSPHGY